MPNGGEVGDRLAKDYSSLKPRLDDLNREVRHIVERTFASSGIKIHSIVNRVKSEASVRAKLQVGQGEYGNIGLMTDLVGLRVVVLFLGDLPRIVELLSSEFDVQNRDDKVAALGEEDAFGYMSIHLDIKLKDEYCGPRYDHLKDLNCEIQIRTLLMDAWANVSHHLDYKGKSSIPNDLQRDFHALSGLFYVADKHFELFFAESSRSQSEAVVAVANMTDQDLPLNLDTLEALLNSRYRNREEFTRREASELVEEFSYFGFNTISSVINVLEQHTGNVVEAEALNDPGFMFTRIGFARVALQASVGDELWSEKFNALRISD